MKQLTGPDHWGPPDLASDCPWGHAPWYLPVYTHWGLAHRCPPPRPVTPVWWWGSPVVLGTVQPFVSPWCPSTAMDTRRAQQGHSSVVAPLGRAAGKGSPGQQDALRWPFLAQNHLSGFFPAVLLPHPSSPFTPITSTPLLPPLKSWLLLGWIFAFLLLQAVLPYGFSHSP